MQPHSQQTFFLPKPVASETSLLSATIYNLAHTLLNRTESDFVFVPIRSMQYLAVIDGNDFWFVDSQAYAVNEQQGGRIITLSWHTETEINRDSLDQNIPVKIICYDQGKNDTQLRITGEFHQAMKIMDKRYRDVKIPAEGARIIDFKH